MTRNTVIYWLTDSAASGTLHIFYIKAIEQLFWGIFPQRTCRNLYHDCANMHLKNGAYLK